MKKLTLIAIIAGLFSLNVHADWDPALEAREAAERKAGQQRTAKQKPEHDKMIRESSVKAYRTALARTRSENRTRKSIAFTSSAGPMP